MLLTEYVEDYNGAPISLEEFAYGASQVRDNVRLSSAALAYLDAQKKFEEALRTVGVEQG